MNLALKTVIIVGVGIGMGGFVVGVVFGSWLMMYRWRVQDGRDRRWMREMERKIKANHNGVWKPRYRGIWKI